MQFHVRRELLNQDMKGTELRQCIWCYTKHLNTVAPGFALEVFIEIGMIRAVI